MSISFCPRLALAANLLPRLRAHLVAAASRHMLPDGFSFDLLPIVDDGVFGYELLPQRETHTYLTLGCDSGGRPVLRKSLYCAEAPSALRLATINGRALTQSELDAWHRIQSRDFSFSDWPSAAEAAWRDFAALFPDGPRRPVRFHDDRHSGLDEALVMAHSFLAAWDRAHRFLRSAGRGAIRHRVDGCQGRIGAVGGANGRPLDIALGRGCGRRPRALGRVGVGCRERRCLGMRRDDAMQRSVLALPVVCRALGLRVPAALEVPAARERGAMTSGGKSR